MDWEDLRVFLAVARAGSLAAAGRRLRLSQATVWRRMRALDESLNATLFERRSTGYVLTAQGTAFLRALQNVDQTIESARRRLTEVGDAPEGEVRVAIPEFLAPLVARRAAALVARHPQLRLETVSASPVAQLGVRDADISLRVERPLVGGYWISDPYPVAFALYASPGCVEQHGAPASLAALAGHRIIDFDHSIEHAAPEAWRAADLTEAVVVFRSSSPHARLAAARAGLGLAMLPVCFVGDDTSVQPVLASETVGTIELLICISTDLMSETRIAATLAFLEEILRES